MRVLSIFKARPFATAAKGASTRASIEASTGSPTTLTCSRTSATASNGNITTSTHSSGPAGSRVCDSSGRTTGIAWAPKRSSGPEQALRILAGSARQENEMVATSFALLFLAKGRAPVLINKLRHSSGARTGTTTPTTFATWSRSSRTTGRTCSPGRSSTPGPRRFRRCSRPRSFSSTATKPRSSRRRPRRTSRRFVEQGGFIFADACCGSREFDRGFKRLMKELFPETSSSSRPCPTDHPVWRAKHLLAPDIHPLLGIEHGCRTVVIYSPADLSCYWNQTGAQPGQPRGHQGDQGRSERHRLRHRPRDAG